MDYRVPGVEIEGGEVVVDPESVTGHLGEDGNAYVFLDVLFSEFSIDRGDGSSEVGEDDPQSATLKLTPDGVTWRVAGVDFDAS